MSDPILNYYDDAWFRTEPYLHDQLWIIGANTWNGSRLARCNWMLDTGAELCVVRIRMGDIPHANDAYPENVIKFDLEEE